MTTMACHREISIPAKPGSG